MRKPHLAICLTAVFALLLLGCTAHTPSAQTVSSVPEGTSTPTAQELTKLKAKVMSADYRADIDELSRLRDEVAKLGNDPDLGYLAHYWSGFASWRMAINGANHQMKTEEQKTNLLKAGTEFYSSTRLKDDFADGYASAAGVNSWLPVFDMGPNADRVVLQERMTLARALLSRAIAIDPGNPRVLWTKAAFLLFAPPPYQNVAGAIEVYRQMLQEAERRGVNPASPFPDWGKPEALMSLAYAHSRQTPPDLQAALDEANAALKVQPDWSYVRDNLLPQLEQQRVNSR